MEMGEDIICYAYRKAIKTGARTEWLFYSRSGKINPIHVERSRSGAHGEDCYLKEDINRAIVEIKVEISNSGKDYSTVKVKDVIQPALMEQILEDLREYSNFYILARKLFNEAKRIALSKHLG